MSIPPLVCNTPPPPDQCEDATDHDEYDLQYNLSQDDDDEYGNGYDFQSYSTFNHFQTQVKHQDNTEKCDQRNCHSETTSKCEPQIPPPDSIINTAIEIDLKCDKEIIEDLNLEVDSDQSSASFKETDKSKTEGSSEYSSDNATDLSTSDIPVITNSSINNIVETPPNDDSVSNLETFNETKPAINLELINEQKIPESIETFPNSEAPFVVENQETSKDVDDDFDFGDFAFQSANTNTTTAIIDSCDNPWENNESCDNFGDFKANFDSGEDHHQPLPETEPSMKKNDGKEDPNNTLKQDPKSEPDVIFVRDDEFGDFDDFQSSSNDSKVEAPANMQLPIYSFNTDNEGQVIDNIHKVIVSMFQEDIEEPTTKFEGKLESLLCETWRYLLETDVRQPYMVTWNNSLGQQTLLKALCIDSRNILFGPKWSSNTPKYAANLCTAPLQPQKQASTSTETRNPEKNATKSAEGWTDPFKTDGHEFTYAEALLLDLEHLMATLDQMAHNNSSLKISDLLSNACSTENIGRPENEPAVVTAIRPSDLDVFETTFNKKSEIHSTTIPVQPLRQINLPDTHIFTPSDSETPRSKTIHYDNGTPIMLPQTLIDNTALPKKTPVNNEKSDEYWEFQDFKGASASDAASLPNKNKETSNASGNQTYQTQILQPIKIEPITPTVCWPDPGEVKETFEDFTDFVAHTNWNNDKQESLPTSHTQKEIHFVSDSKVFDNNQANKTNTPNEVLQSNDAFDDEFDTFQSAAALPPKSIQNEVSLGYPNNGIAKVESLKNSPQILPSTKIDFPLPGNRYDALSFMHTPSATTTLNAAPNTSFNQDSFGPSTSSKPLDLSVTNSPILTPGSHKNNVLQPISASSTQNHQKTGQILQPLSLESYSQINWPNPGMDFQDLSRFNPVETLQSLKSDLSSSSGSKSGTPVHTRKSPVKTQVADDDWGDFVSSKPKPASHPKKTSVFVDDDEWTDFVSSPSVKPPNGLNTISLNVHTNLSMQMSSGQNKPPVKNNTLQLDIPSLNYITPKSTSNKSYNDRHFQNL